MGISIYYRPGTELIKISRNTDLNNPVITVHDGKVGGAVSLQLFLRNDDSDLWFSNVVVRPVDLVDAYPYGDVVYTETGWGVKLSAGSAEPTNSEWEDIEWGNSISMPNIGTASTADTTTYSPFWYMISCPPNIDAITKTDIVLRVSRTTNAVS